MEQMPKVCVRLLQESIDDPENEEKKIDLDKQYSVEGSVCPECC